jgi:hypothetical protein
VRCQEEEERNLDARRRRKQKKTTQNKVRCWRNLVAARRGTTHRAKVAWQKLNQWLYQSQNKKKPAAERRSRPTAGANAARPLTVNGSASGSMFRRHCGSWSTLHAFCFVISIFVVKLVYGFKASEWAEKWMRWMFHSFIKTQEFIILDLDM